MNSNDLKNVDSKEFFLDYLNTEIEQIREDMKTPGWTHWAIIGASATIFWLLILEVEKGVFDLDQMLLLFVLVSLLISLFRLIYDITKPKLTDTKIQYSSFTESFTGNLWGTIFRFIHRLLLVFIVIRFFPYVNKSLYYSMIGCNTLVILAVPIVFLIRGIYKRYMQADIYVPNVDTSAAVVDFGFVYKLIRNRSGLESIKTLSNSYSRTRPRNMLPLIVQLLTVYWIIGFSLYYLTIYPVVQNLATISSLKIAVLAVAEMSLIGILLNRDSSSTTLKKLVDIRRDIVFDNISVDIARELTEIAIYGLNKSAVVQAEVANHISTLQKIDTELNNAQKKNDATNLLLSEIDGELTKDKLVIWESLRETAYLHFRKAREAYLSDLGLRGSNVVLSQYLIYQPSDTNYLTHLEKLSNLHQQVKQKYDSTIWEWLNYINKFEGKDSALAWLDIAISELKADLPSKEFN